MFSFLKRKKVVVRHRPEHCVSRKLISKEALKVLYRLSGSGYKAYLVGGGVRDILLGRQPKDFDVVTDALPREIKRLFSRSFIIGRRFRLVHVVFGDTVIETSTFRKSPSQQDNVPDGELYQSDDNTFGTPEEDAMRRDFTVNGLFYDIKTFDLIDYVGGLRDLEKRLLRSIGDPNLRFREDPVRMMRAIRLACKLGLDIERGTRRAISRNYREIEKASEPRILEELFRMFPFGASSKSFRMMWDTKLLGILMPRLAEFIDSHGGRRCKVWDCLDQFDAHVAKTGADPSYGLRIAAIYLAPYMAAIKAEREVPRRRRRMEIAEGAIRTMDEKYKMPRIALQHAVHLLSGLEDFREPPQPGKVVKDREGQFSDLIVLARIAARALGDIPEGNVDAWGSVKRIVIDRNRRGRGQANGAGAAAEGGPNAAAGGGAGAAPAGGASSEGAEQPAPAENPARDAAGQPEQEDGGAAKPHRRRRRGRRGRRRHAGGEGAQPAPEA